MYTISDEPQQALLGNWGLTVWNGPEAGQVERQHCLRVKGRGSFRTLVVPWRKGEKPPDLLVESASGVITVRLNKRIVTFTDTGYSVQPPLAPPQLARIIFEIGGS